MLKSIAKAASAVVDIPAAAVADLVTIGGAISGRETTYTGDAAKRLLKNIENIADPDEE